jgi:hypothetical protein
MQIFQVVVSLFKRGSFFENEEAASLFSSLMPAINRNKFRNSLEGKMGN